MLTRPRGRPVLVAAALTALAVRRQPSAAIGGWRTRDGASTSRRRARSLTLRPHRRSPTRTPCQRR
jgi:hypothetical protein